MRVLQNKDMCGENTAGQTCWTRWCREDCLIVYCLGLWPCTTNHPSGSEIGYMLTLRELRSWLKFLITSFPSQTHVGCSLLSPPLRRVSKGNGSQYKRWGKRRFTVWVHETQFLLVSLFVNYCIISHTNTCKPTFAPPCMLLIQKFITFSYEWDSIQVLPSKAFGLV